MVFKAEKPPSRLSRATPKWCRSTLSLRQLPFQLRGSEADEGYMRENPPLATTGCDEVLCTAATEASKYYRTCQSTSRKDALEQFTKIMVSNEGKWVKKETPHQYDDIALARASSLLAGC